MEHQLGLKPYEAREPARPRSGTLPLAAEAPEPSHGVE
jgi:hypothetical protein